MKKNFHFFLALCTGFIIASFSHEIKTVTQENKFVLIISLYNEKHPARAQEYIYCLKKNLEHPHIDTVHIVYDVSQNIDHMQMPVLQYIEQERARLGDKLRVMFVKRRPTYDKCFKLANKEYAERRIILANGDIYFNETLALLDDYNLEGKFLAFTRYEVSKNGSLVLYKRGNFEAIDSQDAWIFKTPIHIKRAAIELGIGGCDGRIAYRAEASGYSVSNPCLDIQCIHKHDSQVRHYSPHYTIPGHRKFIEWTHLR